MPKYWGQSSPPEAIHLPKDDAGRRKTVLRTVRISESSAHSLENEAVDESTTVNALINSIIRRHFEWDKKAEETGFTSIHRSVLKAIIEELDDEALLRIGRDVVPGWFKDMAEYWFQDSSPDRILDTINLRFKFNPLMRVRITREGDKYTVVLRHDLGPKWSILAEGAARELTRKYFHVEAQISRGESVVTGRFKTNPADKPRTSSPH
jgi:hypothetical protein